MSRNPSWTRDELILALDLYFRSGRHDLPKENKGVIELSELLNQLPIHERSRRQDTFRNPEGVSMKLANIMWVDPDYPGAGLERGGKLVADIWAEFSNDVPRLQEIATAIRNSDLEGLNEPIHTFEDDEEFVEGRILTAVHRRRERSPKLADKKKQSVLKKQGTLSCEVCGFDFHKTYGQLGQGYAECHHLIPLSELSTTVRNSIKDLAIVCSNCHGMLHKSKPVLSIVELRSKIRK